MRQGLDKYPHRNGHVIKHKKDDFRVPELRFPNFRIRDFEPQEYSLCNSFQYPYILHLCFNYHTSTIIASYSVVVRLKATESQIYEFQKHDGHVPLYLLTPSKFVKTFLS